MFWYVQCKCSTAVYISSLLVFWLTQQAHQNAAQLVHINSIYSDTRYQNIWWLNIYLFDYTSKFNSLCNLNVKFGLSLKVTSLKHKWKGKNGVGRGGRRGVWDWAWRAWQVHVALIALRLVFLWYTVGSKGGSKQFPALRFWWVVGRVQSHLKFSKI